MIERLLKVTEFKRRYLPGRSPSARTIREQIGTVYPGRQVGGLWMVDAAAWEANTGAVAAPAEKPAPVSELVTKAGLTKAQAMAAGLV